MMLRSSRLLKLITSSVTCPGPPIALMGTEVGVPVSTGLTVEVLAGTVTATGAGYDFIDGVLRVSTKKRCPLTSEMTFSITGTGPVPALVVRVNSVYNQNQLIGVLGTVAYAAFKYPGSPYPSPYWAIQAVPVSVPAGAPYELKCSIADTWVGVWLNGTRIARAEVTPGYLATSDPWHMVLGSYSGQTYTGLVSSASLVTGSLPDIDVL